MSSTVKTNPVKQWLTDHSFARFCATRFLLIIPTVFILVTLVFFIMRATGDPITATMGGKLPPDQIAQRIHEAGYDRPVIIQFFEYLGQLLHGDLGMSSKLNMPVTQVIATYGTATLELALLAILVAFAVGIPLGKLAAKYRDKLPDAFIRLFSILCYAMPVFFLGLLLKMIFTVNLGLLPSSGRISLTYQADLQSVPVPTGLYIIDGLQTGNPDIIGDVLSHAILPAVALGLLTAATFIRLIRTNVISTLSTDYIFAARSRGVSEKRILNKHAWKPSLIPIITVMGMQIALLLAGAVLTETTFEWKGIGYQLAELLKARDFLAVQGIVIMIAIIVSLANFIVDVLAAYIDPRVRYGK
ncbi:peptide ABC transporter permease [Actinomycetota bacterium]|nr:peptide ABC transporter permease [Actinomycetota bacterium]